MSRSQRLLDLLQILRSHRMPVSGVALAAKTGVSLRTLYRDIATLQAQGADIEGEAGVGYVLRPGFLLPPLMFSQHEIEALVLGSRWVAGRADAGLAEAARAALVKIGAVLPEALREELDHSTLLVGPGQGLAAIHVDLAAIRDTILQGKQGRHHLSRRKGGRDGADYLAFRTRFFRSGAGGAGLVRDTAGLPQFPG